ncbi:MAG: sigma-70 family RNA polymerase sigma factor [Oscillospiraceae bacterium]|nr:sigma-70 family RNA polymerase sigma factor [Oscillospiraceae bacterium]
MITDEQYTAYARMYMDTVFRVAFNYLKSRSDADDITQNVLIKLYRANKTFENNAHIKHWLIRVTINECKRTLLSPWRHIEPIEDYIETLSFEAPEQNELFEMVMKLPAKYRISIFLYYFEDYSTEEIAQLLNVPNATVRTRLKRAREHLKSELLEVENNA